MKEKNEVLQRLLELNRKSEVTPREKRQGPHGGVRLAGAPHRWPKWAYSRYTWVLHELRAWCRKTGASQALNEWVAERAVREAFGGEEPSAKSLTGSAARVE